jgi:hypothetical protein
MPSDFPRRPKFIKGALVEYQSEFVGAVPNVIVFQYNPEELSRSLSDRSATATANQEKGVAREDRYKVKGPPEETIEVTIELDAADQLGEPARHPHVVAHGLQPALAALELLLYPKTSQIMLNRSLAQAGTVTVQEEKVPLVLFVWGRKRVLPVRLTRFNITEQAFDQALNPIRAQVNLSMTVMTYMDLEENSLGYQAYMASQAQKETLARLNLINSAQQILDLLPF